MSISYGVEKIGRDELDIDRNQVFYAVVSGDDIVCICSKEKAAQKIMYALNRKAQDDKANG